MSDELSPELETRAELAFARIAEDPGLTGDLVDADACILLKWAQREVNRLVTQAAELDDEEATAMLNSKLSQLRKYLRRTAKLGAAAPNPAHMLQELLTSYEAPQKTLQEPPLEAPPEAASVVQPEAAVQPKAAVPFSFKTMPAPPEEREHTEVMASDSDIEQDVPKPSFFTRLFGKRGKRGKR